MPRYDYAIAAGWDVPLVSLTNIETFLAPYIVGYGVDTLAPLSVSFNDFPNEKIMLDGSSRGDGQPTVE